MPKLKKGSYEARRRMAYLRSLRGKRGGADFIPKSLEKEYQGNTENYEEYQGPTENYEESPTGITENRSSLAENAHNMSDADFQTLMRVGKIVTASVRFWKDYFGEQAALGDEVAELEDKIAKFKQLPSSEQYAFKKALHEAELAALQHLRDVTSESTGVTYEDFLKFMSQRHGKEYEEKKPERSLPPIPEEEPEDEEEGNPLPEKEEPLPPDQTNDDDWFKRIKDAADKVYNEGEDEGWALDELFEE